MATPIPDEILAWAESRPSWQRDALRRLFHSGSLSSQDLQELTHVCRKDVGLEVPDPVPPAKPLTNGDIAGQNIGASMISLTSIANIENINALAPKLSLPFAESGLSVVYGDNGAGKSGYARILKHACRARGDAGSVLPDIFEDAKGQPTATIAFLQGQRSYYRKLWMES